ncbi:MAG: ATP-binding protein, partial [Solirubrobacterales bacterium]
VWGEPALGKGEPEGNEGVWSAPPTGVNTGEVVAGDAAERQNLVTGDAGNVAARLKQTARPGEILLGDATHRLAREAVRVDRLEPLELKGKTEPLPAWRLVDLVTDVPTFTRPIATPFVGRGEELGALEQAFQTAARERACTLATIVGPPGIGKSRLAREFIGALGGDALVVVGRCLPYGEGITYWPLAEMVRQLAGAEVERELRELVAADHHAALIAAKIAGAIGWSQVAGSPEETAWAFRRLFEAVARERPLLIVVDDIHWAEPTLLDLLEYLLSFSSGAAILLLCIARPDLFDARPSWAAPRPNTTLVSLAPLADDETKGLIDELLRQRRLSERAKARIVAAAEGNPLFVEQILALQAEGGEGDVVIPPTIQALLAARIDRLEPEERAVLESASVEGRLFHRDAVAELLPAHARTGIGAHLMSLVRKEFLRPDRASFPGDDGFRFNHVLICDAAYESMPKQVRGERHERYAGWLEQRTGGNVVEYEEILGYHLEQASRCLAEVGAVGEHWRDLSVRAAERLGSAGRAALKRGDIRGSVNLLSRATLLPRIDASPGLQFLPDLAEALSAIGEHGRAGEVLAEAADRAVAAEDVHTGWRTRLQRAWLRFQTDPSVDVADVLSEAVAAVGAFERLRDDRALAHAWHLIAWVNMTYGRLSGLSEAVEHGLVHSRAAGDALTQEELTVLEILAGPTGPASTDRVSEDAEAALERARVTGSRYVEGACLIALAMCAAFEGRFDPARDLIAEARSIHDELGGDRGSGFVHWPAGMIEMTAGDATRAERELRNSYETLRSRGDTWWLCGVAAELADALWLQGRDDEAFDLTRLSEELAGESVLVAQMMWRGARAKVLARRGQAEEAETLAREGVALMEGTEYVLYHADALTDLAEVLRLQDRPQEAVTAAEEAERLYERKGNVAAARTLRALIEKLGAPAVAGD